MRLYVARWAICRPLGEAPPIVLAIGVGYGAADRIPMNFSSRMRASASYHAPRY